MAIVNLLPAQSEVYARLKSAKAVYMLRVQAWDDQGNPWVVGVPDLGHDMTRLLQANLLPEFRKLKPAQDADVQNDPADALPPGQFPPVVTPPPVGPPVVTPGRGPA